MEWHPEAFDEWNRLDKGVKEGLKEKLLRRLEVPNIPKAALRTLPDCYKIKHGSFRLVYQLIDKTRSLRVLAVGHRDKLAAYKDSEDRLR